MKDATGGAGIINKKRRLDQVSQGRSLLPGAAGSNPRKMIKLNNG